MPPKKSRKKLYLIIAGIIVLIFVGWKLMTRKDQEYTEFTTSKSDIIESIDLVYEATGASRLCFDVLKYLGTNGVFVFTGVPGRKAPIEVETDLIMRNLVLKNQVVFGTVNADRQAFEDAGEDLQTFVEMWPEAVRSLISGHYPLEEHEELLHGHVVGIKNVIQLSS